MIYVITTFRLPFTEVHGSDIVEVQARTVAYYLSKENAVNALLKNAGGLDEAGYYPFAVIEELEEGLYPDIELDKSEFWQWNHLEKQWLRMPDAPEDKAWMNYAFPMPLRWGQPEYSLERFSGYARIG